jgi:hypothetical protein
MATQTRYASKDAFMGKQISGGFSGWNGKDDHLPAGKSVSGTYKWRSVVYFSVDFSPMLGISSATLYLYNHSTGSPLHSNQTSSPSSIDIARMTADWGEGSTNPGEGNLTSSLDWDWDNRYDKTSSSGVVTKNITQGANGSAETFDVTDIVTAWFNGSANNGFMIRNNDESSSSKGVQFYSREAGGALRPKLVIEYVTNTAPSAPTLTSPVSGAIVNTLTPTLSGAANDSDAGDYITNIQIQVADPVEYLYSFSLTNTASDPGAGYFRTNSGGTAIYISETDLKGVNRAADMASWSGRYFHYYIGTKRVSYLIGTVTDNGTWRTLGATYVSTSEITPSAAGIANVEIDSTADGDGLITMMWDSGSQTVSGTPTSFSKIYGDSGSPSVLSGNTFYKWRAKTCDRALEWSPWSEWGFFKPNTTPNVPSVSIQSPSSDIADDTPDFTITHDDNDPDDSTMYGYQVVVEKETSVGSGSWTTTGGWDSGQADTSGSPATVKVVTSGTLTWGGSYRVKARTKDQNGAWSSYSPWQTFYIHKTLPPINLAPSSGEGVSATPTLTGAQASSTDAIQSYQIIFYDSSLGVTSIKDTGVLTSGITSDSAFSYTYSGLPTLTVSTTYYYRVRVTGAIGGTSEYSALQSFTVVDATTPTITSPVGSGITDLTPDIVITRATVYNRLQIEVYPASSTSISLGTAIQVSGTKADADADTIITGAGPTTGTWTYSGAALAWATTYKIRARVSSDGGTNWSTWSGLSAFSTDSAGTPTLTTVGGVAQSGTPWITDFTPDFVITRAGSDTIDQMRVRVLNSSGSVQIWDSGMTDVANGTTGTLTYSGPTLVGGTTYSWTASYQKSTGPTGVEATPQPFRLNGAPTIPGTTFPSNSYTFSTGESLLFSAVFSDPDTSVMGDLPADWEIVVELNDGTPFDTENVVSGLLVGTNSIVWPGTAFTTGVDYRWKTRFMDSKSVWGEYSSYNTFRIAAPPNGTFTAPSSGFPTVNTINMVNPDVTWSYSGDTAQLSYTIKIEKTNASGVVDSVITTLSGTTTATTKTIPAGYLLPNNYYKLTLTVRSSTDLLYDPTPSSVLIHMVIEAPDPITGLSATADEENSKVTLDWDEMTLKANHIFVAYYVYRRLIGDTQWQLISEVNNKQTSSYNDWYAGNSLSYQYRVNAVTTKNAGIHLESGDDPDGGNIAASILDADVWMIIGADRADAHIQEVPVDEEGHNRPVQQEVFETIGADRKVIVRGFVLGHEGTLSAIWDNRLVQSEVDEQVYYNYTVIGRRLLDYITDNKGPHILKSPFGDVWDVEFSGPSYRWIKGGHLEVDLEWIETGSTSRVSV